VRFGDLLRTAVLLFAGGATACGIVAIAGAQSKNDTNLIYLAIGWWVIATFVGGWLGRGAHAIEGIARLLADARSTQMLPEVEPGRIVFNRLWLLVLTTIAAGGIAFLLPQVPAIGAGFFLLAALWWRRQPSAVQAIEERDGVRFYVERTSPFAPTRLIRTPGFRRNEPAPTDVQHTSA
jgi:hypothetical protein